MRRAEYLNHAATDHPLPVGSPGATGGAGEPHPPRLDVNRFHATQ